MTQNDDFIPIDLQVDCDITDTSILNKSQDLQDIIDLSNNDVVDFCTSADSSVPQLSFLSYSSNSPQKKSSLLKLRLPKFRKQKPQSSNGVYNISSTGPHSVSGKNTYLPNGGSDHGSDATRVQDLGQEPVTGDLGRILEPDEGEKVKEREVWSSKVDFILSAVGYAVGFGNVWRFPYFCYSNGGGAFLIPYVIMVGCLGLPLFYLELGLGQYASLGPISVWILCPIFKGIGYTMVGINVLVAVYYNVILAFSIFYMFASMTSQVPWAHCGNSWNINCNENKFIHANACSYENSSFYNYTELMFSLTTTTYNMTTAVPLYISQATSLNSSILLKSLISSFLPGNTTNIATSIISPNWIGNTFTSQVEKTTESFENTTEDCVLRNRTEGVKYRSPSEEYWLYYVLGDDEDTNVENIGSVRPLLLLCNLFAWIIVVLCIIKGVKSSGKIVYFTATFPYLILTILLVRGLTLPGASLGIKYYLTPDFKRLGSVKVWKEAATQILFSLGPGFGGLITLGSYNKFNNKFNRDAVIVTVINCSTSIFAGFVIFSVLGFLAHKYDVPVDLVVDKGPGLAFIAYPEALAMMPGAPFWSICFFFMLLTLGLDSQFVGIECIVTGLKDEFTIIDRWKKTTIVIVCLSLFLLGIPCVTQGGMYVIEILDKFTTTFPLLLTVFIEAVLISWIYGYRRFSKDIEMMIGHKPNIYWIANWTIISPAIIMAILVFTCIEYNGVEYSGYKFPPWAEFIGWMIVCLLLCFIPGWAIIKLCRHVGTCRTFCWVLRAPSAARVLNLRQLVTPGLGWGPRRSHPVPAVTESTTNDIVVVPNSENLPNVSFRDGLCFINGSSTAEAGPEDRVEFKSMDASEASPYCSNV